MLLSAAAAVVTIALTSAAAAVTGMSRLPLRGDVVPPTRCDGALPGAHTFVHIERINDPSFSPTGDGSDHLETSAAGAEQIAAVRHAAVAHLQRSGCSNIEHAVPVLSELVTNAVLHAGGAPYVLVACRLPPYRQLR